MSLSTAVARGIRPQGVPPGTLGRGRISIFEGGRRLGRGRGVPVCSCVCVSERREIRVIKRSEFQKQLQNPSHSVSLSPFLHTLNPTTHVMFNHSLHVVLCGGGPQEWSVCLSGLKTAVCWQPSHYLNPTVHRLTLRQTDRQTDTHTHTHTQREREKYFSCQGPV